MKVKVLIFNYNLPDVADKIYNKLLHDGFNKKDIVLVDNGSDKASKPDNGNFLIPWNIRLPGQASISLNYVMDYFESDYYLILTTSITLPDDYNLFEMIYSIVVAQKGKKIGFIAPSLKGDIVSTTNTKYLEYDKSKPEFYHDFHYQPILLLISNKFARDIRKYEIGYFNKNLFRGWGIDFEMQYFANKRGYVSLVSRDLWCYWNNNITHRRDLADESREDYRNKAWIEATQTFNKRYSIIWPFLFYTAYKIVALFSVYPSNISGSFNYKKLFSKVINKVIGKN